MDKEIVIACPSKDIFMRVYDRLKSENPISSYSNRFNWEQNYSYHKEESCINPNGMTYSSRKYYRENKYNILTEDEYFGLPKGKFRRGDRVRLISDSASMTAKKDRLQ